QTAYETIKDADPSASVLIGGLAKPNDTAWLEKLLSLGGGKFFDVLNLHIYPAFGTFPSSIPKNRELLAKHGFSKPIWITETSTTGMYFETPDRAREEHNKAVYLAQNYSRAFSEPDVRRVFWHTLKNPGKDVRLARDLDFGLMDGEYRELPAFVAHRIWNSKLLGARAEGREAAATQDLEVYRFAAKTGPVWIAWSRTGESKFRPPSAAASFRVTSLFGEPSTVEAKTLSVTREPVYVEPTP
ncbi:MAG: hypothetical protein JO317_05240, partial [Verrucomicrobiae bacterium]|nr:hypothetical protein [Verrucomicrobiae bacterium]